MSLDRLRNQVTYLQGERNQARHPHGSPEDERQRGEINAFNLVLHLIETMQAEE